MACNRRFVISPAKARRYGFGSELVVVGVTLLAWGGAGCRAAGQGGASGAAAPSVVETDRSCASRGRRRSCRPALRWLASLAAATVLLPSHLTQRHLRHRRDRSTACPKGGLGWLYSLFACNAGETRGPRLGARAQRALRVSLPCGRLLAATFQSRPSRGISDRMMCSAGRAANAATIAPSAPLRPDAPDARRASSAVPPSAGSGAVRLGL
jgi:hypothetical protein